jgi:peptidoglycan/LPS O-acetylase OafA/YrhL
MTFATANPQPASPIAAGRPTVAPASRNLSIDYLRAFITFLVVVHHAVLAYHPYAPPPPASLLTQPRLWAAFPVVDAQRWTGSALIVGFNDVFFMSLMFFLSGLFVWHGLARKATGRFIRDRALRLGLPFVVAAAIIAPLAYYPAYLQTGGHEIAGYWQQWRALGNWPAGPAWFVWVLLAFDLIAAGLLVAAPKWGENIGRIFVGGEAKPFRFFLKLVALSCFLYIPMELAFNAFAWASFGPFFVQTARTLHYLLYFAVGVGVGATGFERGLLAPEGKLARRWYLWAIAALVAFAFSAGMGIAAITVHAGSRPWEIASDFGFVLSCAASSFVFLAVFVRFARKPNALGNSFSNNAYGIYLVHYAFVSWLQYSLLKSSLPAIAKASLVIAAATLLSWATVATLRRIPAVARVV